MSGVTVQGALTSGRAASYRARCALARCVRTSGELWQESVPVEQPSLVGVPDRIVTNRYVE